MLLCFQTRNRVLGGAPSKSSNSVAEKSRRRSREENKEDEDSEDDVMVRDEEPAPKPKRKRGAAGMAREHLNLIGIDYVVVRLLMTVISIYLYLLMI